MYNRITLKTMNLIVNNMVYSSLPQSLRMTRKRPFLNVHKFIDNKYIRNYI